MADYNQRTKEEADEISDVAKSTKGTKYEKAWKKHAADADARVKRRINPDVVGGGRGLVNPKGPEASAEDELTPGRNRAGLEAATNGDPAGVRWVQRGELEGTQESDPAGAGRGKGYAKGGKVKSFKGYGKAKKV